MFIKFYISYVIAGAPDPPSGRPSVVVSSKSAIIAWGSAPYDGGCKVSNYRLEMRTIGGEWSTAVDG
jgi:myosin-light-chain kinase